MKISITVKLFSGFLVVIFLNIFYVVVVSKLSDLNSIVNVLKHQNEAKNALLRIANLHDARTTLYVIYENLGRIESIDNFKTTSADMDKLIDSVISHFDIISSIDTLVSQDETEYHEKRRLLGQINEAIYLVRQCNSAYTSRVDSLVILSSSPANAERVARKTILKDSIAVSSDTLGVRIKDAENIIDQQTVLRIKDVGSRIENAIKITVIILVSMSLFALMFGFIFSRAITNALRRLKLSASSFAKGSFDFAHKGYSNDEIGDLALAFGEMAQDLKKAQDQLVKNKRMAAIGEVVASVNHEINNPLMIISGNAQFLEMSMDNFPEDMKERVRAIIEETERISRVTKKLRDIRNPVVEDYTASGEQMINLDKSS